jgi:hypothetical protein
MTGIQCRSGHVFSMINDNYKDAEWKLQEYYYIAQGCEVVTEEFLSFSDPNKLCSHCDSLEHKFEELIEEIKDEK